MWGMEGRTGAGAGLCHWGILVTSLEHKEKHEIYQERLHFTRSQNNDSFIAPQPGKKQLKMDLEEYGFKERGQWKLLFPGQRISCLYPGLYFLSRLHKK